MLSYDHIFAKESLSTPPMGSGISDKNAESNLTQLNYQMKSKRYPGNTCAFSEDFDFCDEEIKRTMLKKTWNTMAVCFKWLFISKYLKTNYATLTEGEMHNIKDMLVHNKLKDIEFNNKERHIVKLNLVFGTYQL